MTLESNIEGYKYSVIIILPVDQHGDKADICYSHKGWGYEDLNSVSVEAFS